MAVRGYDKPNISTRILVGSTARNVLWCLYLNRPSPINSLLHPLRNSFGNNLRLFSRIACKTVNNVFSLNCSAINLFLTNITGVNLKALNLKMSSFHSSLIFRNIKSATAFSLPGRCLILAPKSSKYWIHVYLRHENF